MDIVNKKFSIKINTRMIDIHLYSFYHINRNIYQPIFIYKVIYFSAELRKSSVKFVRIGGENDVGFEVLTFQADNPILNTVGNN